MSVEKMSGYYQLHIAMSSFCLGCNSWMHEPIPTHLLNIQILLSLHLYLCIRLFKSQLTNRWLHLPDEDEARVRRNSKTWKSIIVASPEATIFFSCGANMLLPMLLFNIEFSNMFNVLMLKTVLITHLRRKSSNCSNCNICRSVSFFSFCQRRSSYLFKFDFLNGTQCWLFLHFI